MWLKSANNAKWLILGTVLASAGFVTIKDSRGGIFPSVYPYRCTLTKFVSWIVTQREIVEVTSRTGDTFTISRGVEACPANDTTATSQTTTAFAFADNDSFQLTRPASVDIELDTYTSTWWSNNYAISIPNLNAYYNWLKIKVKSDFTNTGASTLNINSLWAKTIKKTQWTVALTWWEWGINWIATLVYNSVLDVFQFDSQGADPLTSTAKELLDSSALGSPATSLTSWTFTAKNNLVVDIYIPWTDTNTTFDLQFNSDTGANYWAIIVRDWTYSYGTWNTNFIRLTSSLVANTNEICFSLNISNLSTEIKWLNWIWNNNSGTDAVANMYQTSWVWNSLSQITSITLKATSWNLNAWTTMQVYWAN